MSTLSGIGRAPLPVARVVRGLVAPRRDLFLTPPEVARLMGGLWGPGRDGVTSPVMGLGPLLAGTLLVDACDTGFTLQAPNGSGLDPVGVLVTGTGESRSMGDEHLAGDTGAAPLLRDARVTSEGFLVGVLGESMSMGVKLPVSVLRAMGGLVLPGWGVDCGILDSGGNIHSVPLYTLAAACLESGLKHLCASAKAWQRSIISSA